MSRWTENFENHQFHDSFNTLKNTLSASKVIDENLSTQVEELNRLQKLIAFIDGILSSIDPELIVANVWDEVNTAIVNCTSQLDIYNNQADLRYLAGANNAADKLLLHIRPYMIAGGKAGIALQRAANQYAIKITEIAESIHTEIKTLAVDANSQLEQINNVSTETKKIYEELQNYNDDVFGDSETDGIRGELKKYKTEIETQKAAILNFYNVLFEDKKGEDSLKSKIEEILEYSESSKDILSGMLQEIDPQVEELREFHSTVFGSDSDTQTQHNSLKKEIEERMVEIVRLTSEANTKTTELHKRIESLIPGATTAGLAFAFSQKKESFSEGIENFSYLFYSMIALLGTTTAFFLLDFSKINNLNQLNNYFLLFFGSFIMYLVIAFSPNIFKDRKNQIVATQTKTKNEKGNLRINLVISFLGAAITLWLFLCIKLGFVHYVDFSDISRALMIKLPLFGAIIWLAFYATKRRSEYQRLEQEYAHKEALAISFDSYKHQIESLGIESIQLQEKLLDKTIEAISFNAAQTLDKNHGDKMPALDFTDKVVDKIKPSIDK